MTSATNRRSRPQIAPPSEDVHLMLLVARGDAAAFARLHARFAPPLLNLAQSILRSPAAADDVRQDVFEEIWRRAGEYRASLGTPFSWVMTIARHKAIDRLRAEVRHLRRTLEYERELTGTGVPCERGASQYVCAAETGHAVHGAVDLLSERERQAIELLYFDGLSCTEIARKLNLPLSTIKARVRRALRHLRRPLAAWR